MFFRPFPRGLKKASKFCGQACRLELRRHQSTDVKNVLCGRPWHKTIFLISTNWTRGFPCVIINIDSFCLDTLQQTLVDLCKWDSNGPQTPLACPYAHRMCGFCTLNIYITIYWFLELSSLCHFTSLQIQSCLGIKSQTKSCLQTLVLVYAGFHADGVLGVLNAEIR